MKNRKKHEINEIEYAGEARNIFLQTATVNGCKVKYLLNSGSDVL